MSSWKRRLQETATDWFGLPPDAMLDVSRVTCIGSTEVIVENAVGLIRATDTEIVVELVNDILRVKGREFVVTLVAGREVHVQGQVDTLTYERSVNGGIR